MLCTICQRLGVTEAGLTVLFRLKRGDVISGGQAGTRLERDGFVTPGEYLGGGYHQRRLTEAGETICQKARELGY